MDVLDFKKRRLIGNFRMLSANFYGAPPGAVQFSEIVHVDLEYDSASRSAQDASASSGEKMQAPLIVRADYDLRDATRDSSHTKPQPDYNLLSVPEELVHRSNRQSLLPAIRGVFERFPSSQIHQLGKRRVYILKNDGSFPLEREVDGKVLGDLTLKVLGFAGNGGRRAGDGKMGLKIISDPRRGCNGAVLLYDKKASVPLNETLHEHFKCEKFRGDVALVILDQDYNLVNTRGNPINLLRILEFDDDLGDFKIKDQFRTPINTAMSRPAEVVENQFGIYVIEKN